MEPTIQDELREICEEKRIEPRQCYSCVYGASDCSGISCIEATADTLLAALDARRLEIVRKEQE